METSFVLNRIQLQLANYLFAEGSFVGFLGLVLLTGLALFILSKIFLSIFYGNKSSK